MDICSPRQTNTMDNNSHSFSLCLLSLSFFPWRWWSVTVMGHHRLSEQTRGHCASSVATGDILNVPKRRLSRPAAQQEPITALQMVCCVICQRWERGKCVWLASHVDLNVSRKAVPWIYATSTLSIVIKKHLVSCCQISWVVVVHIVGYFFLSYFIRYLIEFNQLLSERL